MSKIAVVTDSGSDLPQELRERYNIKVVPLVVRFGTETYLDGQLTPDEFWEKVLRGPFHPQTSQPSVGMFEEAFAPLVEQGYHVICPTLTSKHSGTFNAAYTAAQSFPGRVTVFDTFCASLGEGYQAIVAAKAAAARRSVEDIIALLKSVRARTRLIACLDTIEYVRRGGRIDQVIPTLERMVRVLNIKVLVQVIDGEVKPLGAVRSFAKGIQRVQQELAKSGPAEMLAAIHTRLGDKVAGFAQSLAERLSFLAEKVIIAELGPALASHGGPGMIGGVVVQRGG